MKSILDKLHVFLEANHSLTIDPVIFAIGLLVGAFIPRWSAIVAAVVLLGPLVFVLFYKPKQ